MILYKMVRILRIAAALVCTLCVLTICIAPLADLPHITNRTYLLAILLLTTLFAGAFVSGTPLVSGTLLLDHTARPHWKRIPLLSPSCTRMPPLLVGCVLKC
ncbi:MAG: hypothetical protein ACR2JE_17600 [Acidobacteriaceae bacterium]